MGEFYGGLFDAPEGKDQLAMRVHPRPRPRPRPCPVTLHLDTAHTEACHALFPAGSQLSP